MTDLSMPWDPPDGKPLRDRVGGQQAIRLGGSDRDPGREELDQLADRGQFLREQLDLRTAERDRLSDRVEELTAQLRVVTDERDDLRIRMGAAKAVLHEGERAAGSAVNRALAALYAAGDPDGSGQEAPGRYVPGKFTAAEERSILELIAGSPAVDQLVAAAAHAARAGLETALQAAASLLRDALSAHAGGAQTQEADVTPEELAAEMFVAGSAVPGQSGSLARETWGQLGPEFPTKRRYLAMAEAAIGRLRPGALTARAGTAPALPPLRPMHIATCPPGCDEPHATMQQAAVAAERERIRQLAIHHKAVTVSFTGRMQPFEELLRRSPEENAAALLEVVGGDKGATAPGGQEAHHGVPPGDRRQADDVRPRDGDPGMSDVTCGSCGQTFGTNFTVDEIECPECEARRCPHCRAWFGGDE